ncbi:MAG: hypothetical protein R3E73_12075 [Porticoccaceae bacterium]
MWKFLQNINAQGTTIILTTHYLEEAEKACRRIAIIDHGKIVQNTSMKELLRQLNKEVLYSTETASNIFPDLKKATRSHIRDDYSFEIEVIKGSSLNELFAGLSEAGIRVSKYAQQGQPP